MANLNQKAPELIVEKWLNTEKDIKLEDLQGKVVFIEVFQMLCPGCVLHGMPLAKKVHELFKDKGVVVLGLHSVFEHHQAMQEEPLKAFLYEFRYDFPVAIDKHEEGDHIPMTMRKYNLRGTPSIILIDKNGSLRNIFFGRIDEIELGYLLGKLSSE